MLKEPVSIEQFKTAPSDVLIDLLMNALTSNYRDACNALRREYENDLVFGPNGTCKIEVNGIIYVITDSSDNMIVSAFKDNLKRDLCIYGLEDKQVEPIVFTTIELTTNNGSEESNMNEEESKNGSIVPPVASETVSKTIENTDKVGTPVTIPDIDKVMKESLVEHKLGTETNEEVKVLSLMSYTPEQHIQMLFRDPFINWLSIRKFIWDNDYPEAGYRLTGTIPVEHMTMYDDFTYAIISLRGGQTFRVMVAVTNDELYSPRFLLTSDVKDRWMFIGDFVGMQMNNGYHQLWQPGYATSQLKPGDMVCVKNE